MRSYALTMENQARVHLEAIVDTCEAGDGTTALHVAIKNYTFSVAATLLLGVDESDAAGIQRLASNFNALTAGFTSLPLDLGQWSVYGRALLARDAIHEHLARVIAEKRHMQKPADDALTNLLSSVDEATGQALSDEELITQTK
jgi:cytochrome P450